MRWWSLLGILVVLNGLCPQLYAGLYTGQGKPMEYAWYLVVNYSTNPYPYSQPYLQSSGSDKTSGSMTANPQGAAPLYVSGIIILNKEQASSCQSSGTLCLQITSEVAHKIQSGVIDLDEITTTKLKEYLSNPTPPDSPDYVGKTSWQSTKLSRARDTGHHCKPARRFYFNGGKTVNG